MEIFYMIICKDKLCLYRKENDGFERIYLNGDPDFFYNINNAEDDFDRLLDSLAKENNLDVLDGFVDEDEQDKQNEQDGQIEKNKKYDIGFVVVDNESEYISERMGKVSELYIEKKYASEDLMRRAMEELDKDKSLRISEFGVNFDGNNYKFECANIQKSGFSLLGYTLQEDSLKRFLEVL